MNRKPRPLYNVQRNALDKLIANGGMMMVVGREKVALYNSLYKLGYCKRRGIGTKLDPACVYYID